MRPVEIDALERGGIVICSLDCRSKPADPGVACLGMDACGVVVVTWTVSWLFGSAA